MNHVVMFSGGLGSWLAAKRVRDTFGALVDLTLLFADTLIEDADTYRFIEEAAANVGGELVTVKDGRDIWQVFKDDRFLGNSRLANCSKYLKQKPCREWLDANMPDATVYVGIDWSEIHRLPAIEKGWAPYLVVAPMTEPPLMDKAAMIAACQAEGMEIPRLYRAGFPHNNCGGGCVRAGQAQFELLLRENPALFAEWEANEADLREYLDADVSILRDRTGGKSTPLTLQRFREGIEAQTLLFDPNDFGGCGCFTEAS